MEAMEGILKMLRTIGAFGLVWVAWKLSERTQSEKYWANFWLVFLLIVFNEQ